uniref:Fatty acid-binding protein n=1 Tax=Lepeophtheirus salmonis TaxID=72036 RepID=D3PFS8_LEPSM|nr:Fatty acid-binding protein [Lepeophtheirus salmonis]
MTEFLGSWQWSSNSESFDDYLKEIGINIVLRKLSRLANPTVTFLKVNDTWTMRTDTVVKSISVDFNLMKEFKEQTVDGRTLNSTFSIEQVVTQDSKTKVILCQKQIDSNGLISIIDRWIEEDLMHVEIKCNNIQASAVFKKK